MTVYTFSTFNDPLGFAGSTEAFGINASDQIVGQYQNAVGSTLPVLLPGRRAVRRPE